MAASRRRRIALWATALLLLAAAIGAALFYVSRARCFALTGDLICRVETDKPMVALTLDDGPTEQGVTEALTALEARGARATFFLVGRHVAERPDLVGRIAAGGHEIGNHSLTHHWMMGRPSAFYDREIAETHRLLVEAGAPPPALFRPPYGKKLWGLGKAADRHGYRMVMIDVEEPTTSDPRAYAEQMVRDAKPGSILIMHVMYRANGTARAALPLVIEGLQKRGFAVVSVGELLRAGS